MILKQPWSSSPRLQKISSSRFPSVFICDRGWFTSGHEEVAWLTVFRVVWMRGGLYLVEAPGLVPLNLPENEEFRCLCGLVLESRAVKFPQ